MVLALIDVVTIVAGHGYDTGGSVARGDAAGGEGGGGIGTLPVLVVLVLALVTAVLLVGADPALAKAKLRAIAPWGLLAAMLASPLLLWTASSGGGARDLVVERATTRGGDPELVISLADERLNTLEETRGVRAVRIECFAADGRTVAGGSHRWPFAREKGFEVPHAHQPARAEHVRRAARCRVSGTRSRLEADVEERSAL